MSRAEDSTANGDVPEHEPDEHETEDASLPEGCALAGCVVEVSFWLLILVGLLFGGVNIRG